MCWRPDYILGRRIRQAADRRPRVRWFIGNRIFAYRRHAEYLLEDGASPQEIDAALEAYGFAMGPFAVSDMSGLDIAWAMRKRRAATRDPNERYVAIPDRLCEAGRLGARPGVVGTASESGKAQPDPEVDMVIARGGSKERAASGLARSRSSGASWPSWQMRREDPRRRDRPPPVRHRPGVGQRLRFPAREGRPHVAADERGLAGLLKDVEAAAKAGGAGSEPSAPADPTGARRADFADWQRPKAEEPS